MRLPLVTLLPLVLTACGAETATTAATVAELKARDAQEAEEKMERAQTKLDEAMQTMEQRPRAQD